MVVNITRLRYKMPNSMIRFKEIKDNSKRVESIWLEFETVDSSLLLKLPEIRNIDLDFDVAISFLV